MKISIIVTCYNNSAYISKCLLSVIKYINNNFEVIIVNDGSTDNSLVYIENILKEFTNTNIYLYTIKNSGVSYARNFGVSKSSGDYIIFIDGDDWICGSSLQKIYNFLLTNVADVLLLNTVKYYEKSKVYEKEIYSFNAGKLNIEQLIKNKIFGRAWRFVVKKSFIRDNKINFANGLIYEDEKWIPQIISLANKIYYLNEPFYFYRKEINSITSQRKYLDYVNLSQIIIETYEWYLESNIKRKDKVKYIKISLFRCIRNIYCNIYELQYINQNYFQLIYKSNKKKFDDILRVKKRAFVLVKLFNLRLGFKIYKDFLRERYIVKKVRSSEADE